jgi:hypothetical protein
MRIAHRVGKADGRKERQKRQRCCIGNESRQYLKPLGCPAIHSAQLLANSIFLPESVNSGTMHCRAVGMALGAGGSMLSMSSRPR